MSAGVPTCVKIPAMYGWAKHTLTMNGEKKSSMLAVASGVNYRAWQRLSSFLAIYGLGIGGRDDGELRGTFDGV